MRELERARSRFESNLDVIEAIIGIVQRRRRLNAEDREEFRSFVFCKLVERDEAILRKYQGRSTMRAYLATVINRLLLDFRTAQWGKYRCSAEARRQGMAALMLESLLQRHGHDLKDAIQIMRIDFGISMSSEELCRLAHRLPRIGRPRLEPLTEPDGLPGGTTPEEILRQQSAERSSQVLERRLGQALALLKDEDRLILRLRFADRISVQKIATVLGLTAKPLYKRIERCLVKIRCELQSHGVSAADAAEVWLFKTSFDVDQAFQRGEDSKFGRRTGKTANVGNSVPDRPRMAARGRVD